MNKKQFFGRIDHHNWWWFKRPKSFLHSKNFFFFILNWFHLIGLMSLVLLMWKWMGLFSMKHHLLRCCGWLSLLNWIGAHIISIAKTTSKKVGALIRSMEFLSSEVPLYLCKSTIRPCVEYCCYIWAGAPSCFLELLDKLQKRICRTNSPSCAACLEPLAHRRNVASLSLFYRY